MITKQQAEERKQFARDGLYFCKGCEDYFPGHFFGPAKKGFLGKRNKCKTCHSIYERERRKKNNVTITIPKDLHHKIKYLTFYNNTSMEDTLTCLVLKELERLEIKQKPQIRQSQIDTTASL